jgi:hypothetical protein
MMHRTSRVHVRRVRRARQFVVLVIDIHNAGEYRQRQVGGRKIAA